MPSTRYGNFKYFKCCFKPADQLPSYTAYTNIGICGGVPFPSSDENTEILLGDVIISDSLIKYDFGRQYPNQFQRKVNEETLGTPSRRIQGLLKKLKTTEAKSNFQKNTFQHLQKLQNKRDLYDYPGARHDRLFPAAYNHKPHRKKALVHCICSRCKAGIDPECDEIRKKDCHTLGCTGPLVQRERHTQGNTQPFVHIGKIACADTVMKSGKHRNKLAK
ncbi:hypothetical protein TWF970_005432 [Orbilia oligospora]|uniref:Nucleoside phosphorylase domain-containing protein n=1 Tax=Orbilia oligospora TaxID=2813651 RepID=A0A7C8RFQ1_ORBOL|nr:hypothetical protein TWF970_005432 [Orbilia oligospora]